MQSWVISASYAGLQAQALGLAEAAGLEPAVQVLAPHLPWRVLPPAYWPAPLAAVRLPRDRPELVIGCGGMAAAIGAALRRRGARAVQVQNPRMRLDRFDVVIAARHDEITGPNVIVTRTALHRASAARLAAAAREWGPRLAHLPRPLVAMLVGGANGRFRLDGAVGATLAGRLASMMRTERVGLALTPSRRTTAEVVDIFDRTLTPLGGWVWDGTGDNPYFGLLALADMIIVTGDSVSMISEAVATRAPVMLAALPGKSRRIGLFTEALAASGRVRPFSGRCESWPIEPVDDTQAAADDMRRRLGF